MLKVSKLSIELGDKPILKNLSFTLNRGEILGILGKSGCGKTTLLESLAGLQAKKSGTIHINGEYLRDSEQKLVAGHDDIGLVFQDFQLFENLNVFDNVKRLLIHLPIVEQNKRTKEILRICYLTKVKNYFPRELSGGYRQRLAIARAIASEPQLLLLDEPFSHLDNISKFELKEVIQSIVKELNTSVIFVTHDYTDALSFSSLLFLMDKGRIIQKGKPSFIYKNPKSEIVAKLCGYSNILKKEDCELLNIEANNSSCIAISNLKLKKTTSDANAKVIESSFIGEEFQTRVVLQNGTTLQLLTKKEIENDTSVRILVVEDKLVKIS